LAEGEFVDYISVVSGCEQGRSNPALKDALELEINRESCTKPTSRTSHPPEVESI
jgi:hypothetical protein